MFGRLGSALAPVAGAAPGAAGAGAGCANARRRKMRKEPRSHGKRRLVHGRIDSEKPLHAKGQPCRQAIISTLSLVGRPQVRRRAASHVAICSSARLSEPLERSRQQRSRIGQLAGTCERM
jgi:hypothetical protein